VSQLPVPYVPRALVRVRRAWSLAPAPLADWGALIGVALAALTAAAAIAIIAVHTWK